MAKFNPTIKAYLVPYIIEGCDNKNFCYWMIKSRTYCISYTMHMDTHALPDIYTLALGKYIRQSTHAHSIAITYFYIGNENFSKVIKFQTPKYRVWSKFDRLLSGGVTYMITNVTNTDKYTLITIFLKHHHWMHSKGYITKPRSALGCIRSR